MTIPVCVDTFIFFSFSHVKQISDVGLFLLLHQLLYMYVKLTSSYF